MSEDSFTINDVDAMVKAICVAVPQCIIHRSEYDYTAYAYNPETNKHACLSEVFYDVSGFIQHFKDVPAIVEHLTTKENLMTKDIDYLENWASLNENVQALDEKAIKALIDKEKNGEARPQFLIRLYGRFNKLRTQRERKELLSFKK